MSDESNWFKDFYNSHLETVHNVFKALIIGFGIIGAFEFCLEAFAFLSGSSERLAWSGFDPYLDPFFIFPVVLHFYLLGKERLPLPFTFTTSLSFGLLLKHALVSADPNFGYSKYFGFGLGAGVALYLIFLLWPKGGRVKKAVVKQEIKAAPKVDYGLYPLKLDEAGRVMIPTDVLDMHLHLLGGTGSGKTRFGILPWIYQTIAEQKLGAFVYDVKSELAPHIVYFLKNAHRIDDLMYFSLLHPELSMTWNPLAEGNADEIANRVFVSLYYDSNPESKYYTDLGAAVINNLVYLLKLEHPVINFQMLFDSLNDLNNMKALRNLCNKYRDTGQAKYFENNWLSTSLKQRQEALSGLLNKLQRFCNREWSPLINSLEPEITMSDVVTNNKIFHFDVASIKYPDDAKALSIMAILNLSIVLPERFENEPAKPFRVFLDEFYNMAYDKFVDLINKGRSAKIEFYLSHQDFSDLQAISKEFARQISSSATNKVFFNIRDPETAEYASGVFGTVEDKDTKVFSYDTRELMGRPAGYTMPDGRKFRFGPDEVKELPQGYAFVKIHFKHGPEYFQLQMMDGLKFMAPKKFKIDTVLPTKNRHKNPIISFAKETRTDLLEGRTPRMKPNFEKLNALAEEQKKAKPKPPAQPEIIE